MGRRDSDGEEGTVMGGSGQLSLGYLDFVRPFLGKI